jgi:hypothetical protein
MISEERVVKIGFDAEDIKNALRKHYPAERQGRFAGRWTTLTEWCGIDLLALDAWRSAAVIGYEVKVSRSDMRSELLNPAKRWEAVSRCTRFYFAVPEGLLKPEELEFKEPDWSFDDFERKPCPGAPKFGSEKIYGGSCSNPRVRANGRMRKSRWIAKDTPKGWRTELPVPCVIKVPEFSSVDSYTVERYLELQGSARLPCPTCGGTGYISKSKVEHEAPYLWVPKDVGLVEIRSSGVRTIKQAPFNNTPKTIIGEQIEDPTQNRLRRQVLADLVRWTSNRPDPRHLAPYCDKVES